VNYDDFFRRAFDRKSDKNFGPFDYQRGLATRRLGRKEKE
jgi:hypothetical protein